MTDSLDFGRIKNGHYVSGGGRGDFLSDFGRDYRTFVAWLGVTIGGNVSSIFFGMRLAHRVIMKLAWSAFYIWASLMLAHWLTWSLKT